MPGSLERWMNDRKSVKELRSRSRGEVTTEVVKTSPIFQAKLSEIHDLWAIRFDNWMSESEVALLAEEYIFMFIRLRENACFEFVHVRLPASMSAQGSMGASSVVVLYRLKEQK